MKVCTKCGIKKPIRDYHRDAQSSDGHKPACKVCRRQASKEWLEANRERKRVINRRWAAKNRERANAMSRRWRLANPERQAAAVRRWEKANPEAVRAVQRESLHRRRAQMKGSSKELRLLMAQLVQLPCTYCGATENMTIDHIVPLSRGGKHEAENLAPACASCNSRKGARLLSEWRPTI